MWRALLLLSLVPPALASQVSHRPASLEEVVRQSPVIARVEPAARAGRVVSVPMAGKDGPVPAFEVHLDRLRVVEVLRAPPGLLAPGQEVEVAPADVEDTLLLHRAYYVEGVSESPIYERYESGLPPEATRGRHILFLRPCAVGPQAALCVTVSGAAAADADRERILALAKAHPWLGGETVLAPVR